MPDMGGLDQGLAGHTAKREAVTTQLFFLFYEHRHRKRINKKGH
jgi:hypothetical protein